MKLRAPAYPLVTIDPYFSVWSMDDLLNGDTTKHWTGKSNSLLGIAKVDGRELLFLGWEGNVSRMKKMVQESVDVSTFTTTYAMICDEIRLNVRFTSPLLLDDLRLLSRPVSYVEVSYESLDGKEHDVCVEISANEELCLDKIDQYPVLIEEVNVRGVNMIKMGSTVQNPLNRSGDDLRIDWGYMYIAARNANIAKKDMGRRGDAIMADVALSEKKSAVFALAYDDIYSIEYFGRPLKSLWNSKGERIEEEIIAALDEYDSIMERCAEFDADLKAKAIKKGGEKYKEILMLAYRQSIAAHKLVLDEDGKVLFISKECFSNGCAATVDVSYPSIPLFLMYAPELVKGMLRPVYKYAKGPVWPFDFAPHDAGQYPLLNGQVYSKGTDPKNQMPVEECGNVLIMEANTAIKEGNAEFAKENMDLLDMYAKYLIRYGNDPEHQLCTDDFAGHLAHNCNLSLKAIMGIMGLSIIKGMIGETEEAQRLKGIAGDMAKSWEERAKSSLGGYRLAFDKEDSYSMKYNMVWDKIWGTGLFSSDVIKGETEVALKVQNKYGLPLDSRADYTKSDWLVWTATLLGGEAFDKLIERLWDAYNETRSRVPLTDWYDTVTARQVGFQNRTVQAGLFIGLM